MAEFTVILRPVEREPDSPRNTGGLAVVVTNGEVEVETTAVAFSRRHSKNPDLPFGDAVQEELDKGYEAAAALNESLDNEERLAQERLGELRERVEAVFELNPRRRKAPLV